MALQLNQYFNAFRFFRRQQSDDPIEVMCSGCDVTCEGCVFDEGLLVPTCAEVMEHATSDGGNITIEALSIDSGYWRANESSEEVLACYHAEACLGGVTATSGYCLEGYEGPCAWLLKSAIFMGLRRVKAIHPR